MSPPRTEQSHTDLSVAGAGADELSQYRVDFGQIKANNLNLTSIVDDQGARPTTSLTPSQLTSGSKWQAEGQLLASIPSHLGEGIVESAKDAYDHLGRTTFEAASGLLLGAGFCLLSKNPTPIIRAATTWAGRAFLGVAVVDLGSRFARPMADTWSHPEKLEQDKKQLGANLGDAVFNYSLAIAGGIGGAKLGEKYLATTKLGSILQGYKETEISAEALGKLISDPHSVDKPAGVMARAIGRSTANAEGASVTAADSGSTAGGAGELPVQGTMRMREMSDGSHVGSTSDGSVMVLTKDGTALWFKNESSMFGLRNKLGLAKVLHQGGDETDILTGMYSPTTMGRYGRANANANASASDNSSTNPGAHFIGKDPSAYFDTAPKIAGGKILGGNPRSSYTTIDGTKFITGPSGTISAVETGSNRAFIDSKGRWKLGMADMPKTRDFLSLNLNSKAGAFSLGTITDRFNAMRKGAEVGLSEIMLERAGDIGSSVFEHEVLVHGTKSVQGAVQGDAPKPPI